MELSYLPGAASLIEQLDKRISIILRDGRNLVGILRSFDQYMNLSVEETFERVIVGSKSLIIIYLLFYCCDYICIQ